MFRTCGLILQPMAWLIRFLLRERAFHSSRSARGNASTACRFWLCFIAVICIFLPCPFGE